MRTPLVALLGLVLALPPAARAQEPAGHSLLRARLEQIHASKRIRIQTPDGNRVVASLNSVQGERVSLTTAHGEWSIPLADIDALWTRGRSVRSGALIGAVAGLGAGIVYGLLIAGVIETRESPVRIAATVGLVGGLGGAVTGGVIGAAIPRWQQRYP